MVERNNDRAVQNGIKHTPLLKEVIASKGRHDKIPRSDELVRSPVTIPATPARQLSLTNSLGGEFIQEKLFQLQHLHKKLDESVDAFFTLLVPGTH